MPTPSLSIPSFLNFGNFVWSEAAIPLFLISADCTTERVIVEVKQFGSSIAKLSYPNNEGLMIDLQPILRALPNPNRPILKDAFTGLFADYPQSQVGVADVDIYYRLSSWAEPGFLVNKKVLKGGWTNLYQFEDRKQNQYTLFDLSKFMPNKGNLTRIISHMPSGRTIDASQHGWISYMQEIAAIPFQKVGYYVKYNDNTWGVYNKSFGAAGLEKTTWHLPVGIKQTGLDPANKGVQSVDIIVMGGSDGEIILAQYQVKYHYKPCYTWLDIHFRNSLGGFDFIRFDGMIEFFTDSEKKEYLGKSNQIKGANNYFDSEMRLKWKANTGYKSKQEMIALSDLINSTEVYLFFEEDFLPLKCTTKSLKWNDTKEGLFNELIEFETAGAFTTMPMQLMQFFAKHPESR